MTSYNHSLLQRLKNLAGAESDSDEDSIEGSPVSEARREVLAGYRPRPSKKPVTTRPSSFVSILYTIYINNFV